MRLPRDVAGPDIAKRLEKLGYRATRQTGSHLRLTTSEGGQHHVTIPKADLRYGRATLNWRSIAVFVERGEMELQRRAKAPERLATRAAASEATGHCWGVRVPVPPRLCLQDHRVGSLVRAPHGLHYAAVCGSVPIGDRMGCDLTRLHGPSFGTAAHVRLIDDLAATLQTHFDGRGVHRVPAGDTRALGALVAGLAIEIGRLELASSDHADRATVERMIALARAAARVL